MALATNTTEGDIALAGDLNGNVNSPSLTTTGVVPNTYANAKIVVDAKGRIIHAEAMSDADRDALVDEALSPPNTFPDATNSSKGIAQVDDTETLTISVDSIVGFDETTLTHSSSTLKGILSVPYGTGLVMNNGVLSTDHETMYDTATNSSKGILRVNPNYGLTLNSGVVGFDTTQLIDSEVYRKGVVQIDDTNGLSITAGVLGLDTSTLPDATSAAKGIVQIDDTNGLSITAGVLSFDTSTLPDATSAAKGVVQIDDTNGLSITAGVLGLDTLSDATTTSKGVVQIDDTNGLAITAGVLGVSPATNTTFGTVKSTDINNITITAGAIDVGTNVIQKDQNYGAIIQSENTNYTTTNTLTPDFENFSFYEIDNPDFIITINNPTSIPTKGIVVVVKIINSSILSMDTDYISNNINAVLLGVNILLLESTGTKIKASLITDFPT